MQLPLPLIGKVDKPTHLMLGLMAASILVISTATYFIVGRTTSKSDITNLTVPVKSETLTVRITASGTVVPIQSVNISPKTAGLLAELYVEQGDQVKQGQVVARMDSAAIQAQLVQARARLAQTQAHLAQARAGSRPEEIDQARARLAQTQARLALARAGSRTEEIDQARAQVEAAEAKVNLTNKRVIRNQKLAREGAISQDRLDEVLTEDRSAQASLKEAQRRLAQLQNGTRSEEITRAEAEVAEARLALAQLQNGTRSEEIAQAEAEVAAARGELQAVQIQLEDTVIRAPFSGIVTQKYATIGAFVTPTTSASSTSSATSTSIVAIMKGIEILAKVPEVNIGQIKRGQPVEIVADAYPDKVFKGRLHLISPEAVVEQNVTSFQVRVAIETGQTQLWSGMNVDLTFLGEQLEDVVVVPTVAIATQKGQTGVYVPGRDKEPQFCPVTIGPSIQDQTQILKGVKPGEQIFIDFPLDHKPDESAQ